MQRKHYSKYTIFGSSPTSSKQHTEARLTMIPTKRSVIARLRSRSLEGGWSEDSLRRATRIRVFPRNAVMDRKVFSTKRTISSSWTLAVTFAEQYNLLIEFSRVAGTAIFLYWRWAVRASDSVVAPYKGDRHATVTYLHGQSWSNVSMSRLLYN